MYIFRFKKNNHVCHWKYIKSQILKTSFGKISIKYELLN
jgi:hypothetical protein